MIKIFKRLQCKIFGCGQDVINGNYGGMKKFPVGTVVGKCKNCDKDVKVLKTLSLGGLLPGKYEDMSPYTLIVGVEK